MNLKMKIMKNKPMSESTKKYNRWTLWHRSR